MQETTGILNNQYIFWIITGAIGLLVGAVIFFMKKQYDQNEKRFCKIEADAKEDRERLNKALVELPMTYTLREEFLRTTTAQTNKLDKIMDVLMDLTGAVAGINKGEK